MIFPNFNECVTCACEGKGGRSNVRRAAESRHRCSPCEFRILTQLRHSHAVARASEFDPKLTSKAVIETRNHKMTEHVMFYKIIAVCEGKNGPDAEEKIDDFTKLILQKIKNHNDLSKPTDNTDPLADWSFPDSVDVLNRELIGDKIAGRVIRLKVQTTTG